MSDKEKTTESEVGEAAPKYERDPNKRYTYADYLEWDDDERWELIDGIPFKMEAPSRRHQKALGNLYLQFGNYLKGKHCEVYLAPFDVRLNADTFDNTVVQPDILVVCDEEKLKDGKGVVGAPDLAVEILSPSTSRHDKIRKFNAYLKAGIREYWIVDPETKTLAVHILHDGNYITYPYTDESIVPVRVLDGFSVDLSEVFEE